MNIICPKCGKENTIPFSDSEFHTHGFECEDCHKDFGVDDGKMISTYIQDIKEFHYERIYKDQIKKELTIKFDEHITTLTPTITYPNKMKQPIEDQDLTPMKDALLDLFFNKCFILDWNRTNLGLLTGKDESFSITIKFHQKDTITISGTNRFPPYLIVLDQLFEDFFKLEN